jgi:hypothetical protein
MFQHLCVIHRELQNLYFAKLHKCLDLKLLKLKFHKIIRLKYYLVIAEWYSIVCATFQYLPTAVCLCDCIYNLLLLWLECWSDMYMFCMTPTANSDAFPKHK